MPAEQRVRRLFGETFGGGPAVLVRAPGRVNLIGDHTDYHDGFVLPMAIEPATWIAARPRADRVVSLASEGFEPAQFSLDALAPGGPPWAEYLKGVAWALGPDHLSGWDGAVASDVPIGAGLSTSAALEVAAGITFAAVSDAAVGPVDIAIAGQRAENDWVGMPCGIMDQLSVALGRAGHALLIDCRSLEVDPRPLPPGTAVAILDSGKQRMLVESGYEERRRTSERAAEKLGVAALRDAHVSDLDRLDGRELRRARHVVSENARVLEAADVMGAGDAARFGELMAESHASLRDDYESSAPEVDEVVAAASQAPGCYGARITGGGFGGAAVALVDAGSLAEFAAALGDLPVLFTEPAPGASVEVA